MIGINLGCVSFVVRVGLVLSIAKLKALQPRLFSQMRI